MTNLNELVLKWATEKGIFDETDPVPKMNKVLEEANELKQEIFRFRFTNDSHETLEAREDAMMERGDLEVTLICLDRLMDWDRDECLQMAYDKIKNRRGKMINELFVKEEDLNE